MCLTVDALEWRSRGGTLSTIRTGISLSPRSVTSPLEGSDSPKDDNSRGEEIFSSGERVCATASFRAT